MPIELCFTMRCLQVTNLIKHLSQGSCGEWRKVEFGKPGGELYPVFATTPGDLKEFGLGVAM